MGHRIFVYSGGGRGGHVYFRVGTKTKKTHYDDAWSRVSIQYELGTEPLAYPGRCVPRKRFGRLSRGFVQRRLAINYDPCW